MLRRFLTAADAAVVAFHHTWTSYHLMVEEEHVKRYAARQEEKHAVVREAFAALNESDQHFLQSFINNLAPAERPLRTQTERFIEVVNQLPREAQLSIMQKAAAQCPQIILTGAYRKWMAQRDAAV